MMRVSCGALRICLVLFIPGVVACRPHVTDETANDLPYYSEATFTPTWYAGDHRPSGLHTIPAFTLFEQNGRVVTEADLEGRITIANFFFTDCAGICPTTMASLTRLNVEFADDPEVVLLSHSVTPEADSVAKLKVFADLVGAESPEVSPPWGVDLSSSTKTWMVDGRRRRSFFFALNAMERVKLPITSRSVGCTGTALKRFG